MMAKPESTIISNKLRARNLIVLVESGIKHKLFNKNLIFRYFLKRNLYEDDCFATRYLSCNR